MAAKDSSSGVKKLIERLREQGVEEGEKQKERLLQEASAKAAEMLADAEREAAELRQKAQADADRVRAASEAALQLAVRDAAMKLREEIAGRVAGELRQLVARQMSDGELLRQVLLEVARQAAPDPAQGKFRVLLPRVPLGVDELRDQAKETEQSALTALAAGLGREALARGIEVAPGPDDRPGIRIHLVDKDVVIDLTDEAVTQLLLKHLMPRFRALLAGLVS